MLESLCIMLGGFSDAGAELRCSTASVPHITFKTQFHYTKIVQDKIILSLNYLHRWIWGAEYRLETDFFFNK